MAKKGDIMNKRSRVILMIVAASWLSQSASATILVVEDNSDSRVVSEGSQVNGSIDIDSALDDVQYVQPYDIRSVICTFEFQDDGDLRSEYCTSDSYYVPLPHPHDALSIGPAYAHVLVIDNYYVDDPEYVRVDIAGQYFVSGGTTHHTTTQSRVTYQQPVYIVSNDRTSEYTGSLTLSQSFGANGLASLSDDGVVDFTFTSILGDIVYLGYTLTIDIEENPLFDPSADGEPNHILMEIEGPAVTSGDSAFGDDSDAPWEWDLTEK